MVTLCYAKQVGMVMYVLCRTSWYDNVRVMQRVAMITIVMTTCCHDKDLLCQQVANIAMFMPISWNGNSELCQQLGMVTMSDSNKLAQ